MALVEVAAPKHDIATHKFIRDVWYSNLPAPLQKLRTYLWLVVLTRTLGAEGFGAWSLFIVTLSIGTTVATLNCGSSLMRFLSGERCASEINRAFSTVLLMVSVAAALLILISWAFSKSLTEIIFRSPQNRVLIFIAGLALLCDCIFEEIKNLLRARRMNKSWAILSVARLMPEIVATIAVAWRFRSIVAVSWAYVAIGAGAVAAGMAYLRVRQSIGLASPSSDVFRRYMSFGLPLLPGVLASTVSYGADKYVVSYYWGLKQAGIYSACFTLAAATFFLMGPINDVLFPELSALYDAAQREAFYRRFSGIQRFVFGLSAGAAALLAAFPRQILAIFSSGEFLSGATSLAILGVQGIFMAFVLLYVVVLNVRMRVWRSTVFWVISGAAIIFLDVLLVPRIGVVGAAVSQLIVTGAGALVLVAVHWELFRRTFPFVWLLQVGVAFAAVGMLGFYWSNTAGQVVVSLAQLFVGALVFLLCLFATGFASTSDIRVLSAAFLHA